MYVFAAHACLLLHRRHAAYPNWMCFHYSIWTVWCAEGKGVIRFRGRYVRLLKYMGAALVTTHCKLYSTHVVDCRLIAVCSRWSDCCVTFCCREHVLLLAVRKGKVGNVGPKRGLSGTTRRCSGGGDCRFVRGEGNGNSRIDTYTAYN